MFRQSVIYVSVCLLVTTMSPTIRDEPIEMPFGGVDSRGSLIFYYMGVEAFLGGGNIRACQDMPMLDILNFIPKQQRGLLLPIL